MKSRKLDRRIRIERATFATDAFGTPVPTWAELKTVAAQQYRQRPVEAWKAGGTAASLETVWVIRWSPTMATLSPLDRLRYPADADGLIYEISGVSEIGRREGIEIISTAQVPDNGGITS